MTASLDPRTVARIMGGDVIGRDRVLVPGPGHSPTDRSLSIKVDQAAPLGFRVNTFSPKDDWQSCRDYVCGALGLSRDSVPSVRFAPPSTAASAEPSAFALQIWSEAVNARGTLVEKYLGKRALVLPEGCQEALRFHPSCPFGAGVRHPCMIALYRDIKTNEPKAIHRTALTPEGKKVDRKALGPKAGCAIKLSTDEDVADGLTIAEGVETALAGMALNFRPAWALGDAGSVAKFPLLAGIECLTILVDNDASGTGQASALECSNRWTGMGREVFRVVPTNVGRDMADIVCGRAA